MQALKRFRVKAVRPQIALAFVLLSGVAVVAMLSDFKEVALVAVGGIVGTSGSLIELERTAGDD